MAVDDKSIGRLTLDISNVESQVKKVNELLKSIGVGVKVDLSKQVASEVKKQLDAVQKEIENGSKKINDAAQKAVEAINQIGNAKAQSKEASLLDKLEQRVLRFENKMQAEADKTLAKMEANAEKEAAAIEKAEDRKRAAREKQESAYERIWKQAEQREEERINREIARQEAAEERKVAAAERAAERAAAAREKEEKQYQQTWDKAIYEQRQEAMRQYQQDVENYAKALTAYFNEIDNLNKSLASGRVAEGTEQYKAFIDNIARLKEEAQRAGDGIDQAGKKAAAAMSNVQNAVGNLSKSSAALRDSETPNYLERVANAYNNLKNAVNQYNIAKKANNESGMSIWQDEINKQMQIVSSIEQIIGSLNIEESVRDQILVKIQQAKTLQDGFNQGVVGGATSVSELELQMTGLLTRMFSIIAVIRTINNLIKNTVEYVSDYYDKMNEIQIITQKSNEEVAQLGETYRNIAELMNVSSLDMADAAIYFTRQGLGAAEIEKRLKNVTMYAKTANVEFTEAAEIITAVVNSMNLVEEEAEDGRNAAQRVADVFLLVGDNAATSGQEIGSAMQKAAAAAGSFGVSMEWLASYIATVSETTRQEARTIGTALNTIIARLHSIRTTGYNADDNTKVNDIAKALHTVNIELMDQEGNWRDMEDIFEDVAGVWDTLTGKQKSYIATTMAGVKQQNVFLALMKDMAKGAENGSRAYELYNLAINSAGTAQEKYATWTDSVTAAQERLTVAQEKFYSLLDANVIKTWNDALAGWINNIVAGADATKGLNIILPVAIGLITAFAIAVQSAGTASAFFASVWESHPVLVTIAAVSAGVVALVSAISSLAAASETQKERFDALNSSLSETQTTIDLLTSTQNKMNDMFEKLSEKSEITNEDIQKYSSLLETISKVSPEAKDAVDRFKDGLTGQQKAAEELNEELEKVIANWNEVAKGQAIRKYLNWEPEEKKNKFLEAYNEFDFSDAEGLTGTDAFAALLFNQKNKQVLWKHGLTDFYNEYMDKYKEYLLDFAEIYDDFDTIVQKAQSTIAAEMWETFFDASSTDVSDSLLKEINEMIEDVLPNVAFGMNDLQTETLREQILEKIIGTDGKVSTKEYKKAGIMLADAIEEAEVTAFDELRYVANRVFGDELPDEIGSLFMDGEAAQAVADGYTALMEQGFSMVDIDELLKTLSIDKWTELVKYMQNKLINDIGKAAGSPLYDVVSTDEEGREEIDMLMWTQLDNTTLKLIKDMVDVGVSIEDIKQLMRDANGDTNEFIETLKKLGEENGVEEQEEKTVSSAKEISAAIKNAKKELKNLDDVLKQLREGKYISDDDLIDIAVAHPGIIENIGNPDKLIEQITELRKKSKESAAEAIKNSLLDSDVFMANSEYAISGFKTLREYIDTYNEAGLTQHASEWIDKLIQGLLDYSDAADEATGATLSWLEAQDKAIRQAEELNWAKSNNFTEQLGKIGKAYGNEEYDSDWMESGVIAYDRFVKLDDEMKKSIAETYPNLIKAIYAVEEAEKNRAQNGDEPLIEASKRLNHELEKIEKRNSAKYFKSTYESIDKLEKGTISATDAYEAFNKELDKVTKANEDINDVNQKLLDGAEMSEIAASDVSNLASLLGMTTDEVLSDFPAAEKMFNDLTGDAGALKAALDALNEAAFIRITGTSVADFSELENGLVSVQNLAEETIELLKATGQWDTQTITLPQEAFVWDPMSERWIKQTIEAGATVLKAAGNNPYKGTNSSGRTNTNTNNKKSGGGGGSNKNNNEMTEVERVLNRMDQVHAIQEYQQSWYQAQSANFEQNGYLQGVIDANKKEIAVLESQNETLESNIKTIEEYRAQKEKELEAASMTSDEYKEIADDLDKLQKAHQNYTKELIENKTAIDKLNEAIDEQRKKIRDMQINIRNLIYKAIEDREEKAQSMLQNEISMENTILDIIKRKYEIERDKILENTSTRIESLQTERDLLSEQLQLRKEMSENEDKAAKLAQLEANYQRIIADPTRMKEAQNIQKQISELREDIAWAAAEDEIKAQQESIDQQITSLDDYKQYIEEYYEDLFQHPQKLISEMKDIITGTDKEIMSWLKENSEEFANASENTQIQMVEGWQQTLDDMRGKIKTYWDEVEEIIAGGDQNIIEFLKDNSDEYAKAGELQAEKYVEEWKKQLNDLHNALAAAFTVEPGSYSVIEQGSGSGGSGGGGGSGGTAKKKTNDNADTNKRYGYRTTDTRGYPKSEGGTVYAQNETEARKKANDEINKNAKKNSVWADRILDYVYRYARGGLATGTGLAWLDGTEQNPERVLSPYQTQLFESMVKALERISTISVPGMPNFRNMQTGNSNAVSVGDIIVNVDNLDTDDDYEMLANKVSAVLMSRIGQTAVIGGLRINGM